MMMTNPNDDMLDDLFATARAETATPSADLTARVLADAARAQARFDTETAMPRLGVWARIMDALGGWPSVSGLAAATVAGVWIGVAPPSSVQDMTAGVWGDEVSVSLLSTSFAFEAGDFVDG